MLLVTSRFALRLSSEQQYAVPPLAIPDAAWAKAEEPERVADLQRSDAVQLFLERARGVRPDLTVRPSKAGALAEICRRWDGLPLAVELAAARVRLLSLISLAAHLSGPSGQRNGSTLLTGTEVRNGANLVVTDEDSYTVAERALARRPRGSVKPGASSVEAYLSGAGDLHWFISCDRGADVRRARVMEHFVFPHWWRAL